MNLVAEHRNADGMIEIIALGQLTKLHGSRDAEFAILRLSTPWQPVETKNPFAQGFHHGDHGKDVRPTKSRCG